MAKRHTAKCRWYITPRSECAYRDTHEYCPHPDHACNCEGLHHDAQKPLVAHKPDTGRVIIVAAHPDTGELQRLEVEDRYAWALASDVVILGDRGPQ